ncbi:MAG TPA: hypothetical protein VFM21_07360 [Terriglobia bacterium]|nr:hypothetical protein [Terriglobia bacterium]
MQGIVCSECQTEEVRRTHRKGPIERWVLPRFSIYPFVCGMCSRRFRAKVHKDQPVPELYATTLSSGTMPQA